MSAICRDCFWSAEDAPTRCPRCRSPRLATHPELKRLTIAHMDCDAFYASVEKRDRPELRDQPVIVGGGKRGVVTTCCYIARINGVRSAMPMFKALKLCPQATVIKPDFSKYRTESRRIMAKLEALTPLVQPLSLDEAWLDLSGCERLHGAAAVVVLARLQAEIEKDIGITVSIGLAANKFLAKIASDL
ncbi:MAG TPA: DNA polymerase IV, partial [Caulobacteraceae bacterium]|nr:DNA polymerase IV [Caulobacteraceae bacterium]